MKNQSPKEVKMPGVKNTMKDRTRSHISSFLTLPLTVMFDVTQCLNLEIGVRLSVFCVDCPLTLADKGCQASQFWTWSNVQNGLGLSSHHVLMFKF